MGDQLRDRSRRILQAVVEDYIGTAEPVGSRNLTQRHNLDVSPATVRNVMADLEEKGFLASPHTSAGRVPTEKGYRVDSILRVGPLGQREKARIEDHYRLGGLKMEERLREAGKVLSDLSSCAGIVVAPSFYSTVFRQIEFVKLTATKVLVVFVSRSGLIQNRIVEIDENIPVRELEQMTNYLNHTLEGLTMGQVKERIIAEMTQEKALYDQLYKRTLALSREALCGEMNDEVFIEGAVNILEMSEFSDMERMKRLFRAFEQKHLLVELLAKSLKVSGVSIFIGGQDEFSEIEGFSLVTSTYSNSCGTVGTLGVIGPTRMSYSTVIPLVDYTARLLGQVLDSDEESVNIG